MRKFKSAIALMLAGAMMLSMAACGKKEEKSTTEVNSETDASSTDSSQEAIVDDGDWPTTEAEIVEDDRFTIVEGADVLGLDFDDDTVQGFVTYVNGGRFELYAENGEMVADIESNGTLEHSCQIYYDGFTMAKGCVYTISFDVYSTIDRVIDCRVQINGGDYHAYANTLVNVTTEKQTVTLEFTMSEDSDPAPRFVFNMGAPDGVTGLAPHKIYFDNLSLLVTDSSQAEVIEGAPTPIQVKVNQIGYRPEDTKTVIATDKADEKFKIVDLETDETVYIGSYEPLMFDVSSGSNVRRGDFSDFTTPGKYKIISSPSGESYPFAIGEGLYEDVYKDVTLMLYNQRCGCALDSSISGEFAHEACHMQEAVVYGDTSGTTYDVSGGWHDAGDYGRYVVPGAKTIQDLFLAYEDYDYTADDIGIPESGNGVPDLLDEARYELDWMLKMQDAATGGVYHKVTALVFPETVLAVDETAEMVLAPISFAATADFAAVMAKASVLYKDFDADFAATCLDAATKAYAYMETVEPKGYKNPEEIVTGEYPDGKLWDERLWSAAELYIATGEGKYLDAVKAAMAESYKMGLGWAEIGTYALYDLARAEGIDATVSADAKALVLDEANDLLEDCQKEGFYMGLANNYPWGSNMTIANNGMLFLMANNLEPNPDYEVFAQRHRDYIFGVNGTAYCYVTGYGTLTPESTHHRPSQVLDVTMPGMLVGGPDSNLEDPYAKAVLYGMPASLSYVDNEQSFSCNEITIYWNSPLIYLLTGTK